MPAPVQVLAVIALLGLGPVAGLAQTRPVTITLAHDSESERATRAVLERLLERFDLAGWTYTDSIVVDEDAIPHSHPVLTLHARHRRDELRLLSTYLHEQLHWLAADRDDAREAAIDDFRELFPEVPVDRPLGARDERSSYLHLVVCDLELQAMTHVVGEALAREVLGGIDHYTWIYERVFDDPRVRAVNARHGFLVGPPPGPAGGD